VSTGETSRRSPSGRNGCIELSTVTATEIVFVVAAAGVLHDFANAPARTRFEGQTFYFCSDRCREHFESDPPRFATRPTTTDHEHQSGEGDHVHAPDDEGRVGVALDPPSVAATVDPVCGMIVDPGAAAAHRHYEGHN
jgi:YHS domain-containing protein